MRYVARKPLTVSGRQYGAGEVVPLDDLPQERRRQIIDQRRVLPSQPAAKKPAAKKTTRRKPKGG